MSNQISPKIALIIITYNQDKYIKSACESALHQTYEPMDIYISDDCSCDNTFNIAKEAVDSYSGRNKIELLRNQRNLGLIGHINHLMSFIKADFYIIMAGDDISLPNRASKLVSAYLENQGKAFSFHTSVTKISPKGTELGLGSPPLSESTCDPVKYAKSMALIIGATHAWDRKVFDIFGPIKYNEAYEDLVIAFRSMLLGGTHYIDEPLVKYRYEVGLSSQPQTPTNYDSEVIYHLNRYKLVLAVYSQRRDDSLTVSNLTVYKTLDQHIDLLKFELNGFNLTHPNSIKRLVFEKPLLSAYIRGLRKRLLILLHWKFGFSSKPKTI